MSLNSCPEIRLTAQPRSVRRPHQLCSLGARGTLELDTAALRGYDEAFDRVILVTVLGEIPDQAGGLRSLHRALKAGGMLSITEMIIDPDYVSRARVRRLAEGVGFRFVQTYGSPVMLTANFIKPHIVRDFADLRRERSPY